MPILVGVLGCLALIALFAGVTAFEAWMVVMLVNYVASAAGYALHISFWPTLAALVLFNLITTRFRVSSK